MAFFVLGIDLATFIPVLVETIAIYLAISISLNLELGYTGIPNFGKALFVLAGAAFGGWFALHFASWVLGVAVKGDIYQDLTLVPSINSIIQGNPALSITLLVLTMMFAAVIGASLGYLASYPAIRLREDYLAMVLLGSAEFMLYFLYTYPGVIGASFGAQMFDPYAWAGSNRYFLATGAAVLFAVLVYIYVERVARSPLGRTLRAIRDNETAAEALGKDTVAMRRRVLMIASAIAAMAGVLIAFYAGDVSVPGFTRIDYTIWPWVIVIIGGMANNAGVAIAATIFWTVYDVIIVSKGALASVIPFDLNYLVYIVLGSVLIIVLMVRPGGLIREKPTATMRKSRIQEMIERSRPRKPPPSPSPVEGSSS
jgi:branched-chain amino acid transport system permease protein